MPENISYTKEIAEKIRSMIDPNKLPKKGLDELFDSYALLALSKGVAVTDEDVHNAWSVWASRYDPSNAAIVPFEQLDDTTKSQDGVFTQAIRSVAVDI